MRILWRGLELPSQVVPDESVSTDSYGRFIIEPFEQGFGTTIGNSLRRVLLSSLEGAAITDVKIDGVAHEFTTMEGVLEDVTDILLNIKSMVLSLDGDEEKKLTVERSEVGAVTAGDLVTDSAVEIADMEHVIATLTAPTTFRAEMTVRNGRGFSTASDNRRPDHEIGTIPIDSVFSPVLRVRFRTEATRVGQLTNYDRLILEIWTKGTLLPEDALVEAGLILRKHLNPIVMYHEISSATVDVVGNLAEPRPAEDAGVDDLLDKPVSVLNLSVRASNCLEAARIQTLRELTSKTEAELLRVRSFGKTSLHEVQRKLADVGLSLGASDGQSGTPAEASEDSEGSEPEGEPEGPASGPAGSPGSGVVSDSGPMEVFTMGD